MLPHQLMDALTKYAAGFCGVNDGHALFGVGHARKGMAAVGASLSSHIWVTGVACQGNLPGNGMQMISCPLFAVAPYTSAVPTAVRIHAHQIAGIHMHASTMRKFT